MAIEFLSAKCTSGLSCLRIDDPKFGDWSADSMISKVSLHLQTHASAFGVVYGPHLTEAMKRQFGVFYIEDPFHEENFDDFTKLTSALGVDTLIAGDDLTDIKNPRFI